GTVTTNVHTFFATLLDGRGWTTVFLPGGGRAILALALPALCLAGVRKNRVPRAMAALVVAIAILIPTTYETFLVNRVRYIWPFFGAWLVGLAALAETVGDGLEAAIAAFGTRIQGASLLVAGGFIGLLASRISPSIDDL